MSDIQSECMRILNAAQEQDLLLRVIGGMAIRLHSPEASSLPALRREYGDLDFVTATPDGVKLRGFFEALGYLPNKRFNALQGKTRMIFNSADDVYKIDIFIDTFRMCHTLHFSRERLQVEALTIPLAELFLTKLQIIEVNEKDVKDIAALLLEHPLGKTDTEMVNLPRIETVCSEDWGFYTTVRKNIDRAHKLVMNLGLSNEQKKLVIERLTEIAQGMDTSPKSISWKARALIGERLRWYEEPEDAAREAISLRLE